MAMHLGDDLGRLPGHQQHGRLYAPVGVPLEQVPTRVAERQQAQFALRVLSLAGLLVADLVRTAIGPPCPVVDLRAVGAADVVGLGEANVPAGGALPRVRTARGRLPRARHGTGYPAR
jgi:hypothetical protein